MTNNYVLLNGKLSRDIEGNIRTNSYEKNGKKNYSTNVVVESFRLLDA